MSTSSEVQDRNETNETNQIVGIMSFLNNWHANTKKMMRKKSVANSYGLNVAMFLAMLWAKILWVPQLLPGVSFIRTC